MRRLVLLLGFSCWLFVSDHGSQSGDSLPAGELLPPLEVSLTLGDEFAGEVPLDFSIHPRRPMKSVLWEFVATDGVVILDGEVKGQKGAAGEDLPGASLLSVEDLAVEGQLLVLVPVSTRHQWVELNVIGIMEGSDETGAVFDEAVARQLSIEWNRPEVPVIETIDPETGELVRMAVVPTSWKPGR